MPVYRRSRSGLGLSRQLIPRYWLQPGWRSKREKRKARPEGRAFTSPIDTRSSRMRVDWPASAFLDLFVQCPADLQTSFLAAAPVVSNHCRQSPREPKTRQIQPGNLTPVGRHQKRLPLPSVTSVLLD